MTKNVGQVDRVLRIILAVAAALLIFTGTFTGAWTWVLGIVAVILLLTGLTCYCPLYVPLKISTLPRKAKSEST